MSYFGESNIGSQTSSSSTSSYSGGSSSSRKSKKGNNSNKPRQPQRGLGVAQLEKIRLHSQMANSTFLPNHLHHHHNQEDMRFQTGYSPSPSFSYSSSSSYVFPSHQGIMMNMSDLERANMRYGDSNSQPSTNNPSWHPGTAYEPQQFEQPNMTRHFLGQQLEESDENRRNKGRSGSIGSSDENSSDLDLELRLSL